MKNRKFLLTVLLSIASAFSFFLPASAAVPPPDGCSIDHSALALNMRQGNVTPMVAAGYSHTVGLRSDDTVVAVGANSHGQCEVRNWTNIVQVTAGRYYTVGLKSDGTVIAMGRNTEGQCDVGHWTDIVQVSAGDYYTVGLRSDGTVVAVGSNSYGQCNLGRWTDIVQIAAGPNHVVGIKSDGTVVAKGGNNFRGQRNVGDWTDITQVAAGGGHTVGLKVDDTVVAVGNNYYGQCNVSNWTNIVQVAASRAGNTVGLRSDGTVLAVGSNTHGQCDVGHWTDIVQVSAGHYYTVGLRSDGTVVAAGAGFEPIEWNLGIITKSTLIISSTGYGTVITPGEGSFDYSAGTMVRLVAKPELGCHFVKWTGDVGAILNVNATMTAIFISDNYSITADFAINWVLVGGIIAGAVAVILAILFFRTRGGVPP